MVLPSMMRPRLFSISAVREMTTGDLPPSSRVTGTRLRAAAAMIWRATEVAPVNNRWSSGRLEKACPTSGPPVNNTTSFGSYTSLIMASSTSEVAGVNSEGLIITLLPAARAPDRGANTMETGKFQGAMMPITPSGWYSMRERPPSRFNGNPVGRFAPFIHLRRYFLACFIGAIEAPTSVSRVISRGRQLKSACTASANLSA